MPQDAHWPVWRSMLYVPANVRRFVEKAGPSGADAVILDLEDSVPADRKEEARAALAEAVPMVRAGGPDVLVRVNRPLALAVPDIQAAIGAGAQGILLTKVLGPEHVVLATELLEAAPAMAIIPVVETAAALARAADIARASPRVAGMLTGAEDLATELGAAADDEIIVMAKRTMLLAAVAAGVHPYGTLGTVADFRDQEHVQRVVAGARRSGFVGATCIHPSLVPILNAGYSPSPEEVDLARRQLAAAEEAAREGRGSFTVDGRMVDEPILIRARRILAAAR